MGYVEETGAAQHFRDARITTIYEGTTAIQANDLVLRKTLRDGGQGIRVLLADVAATADAAAGLAIGAKLKAAINTAIACTDWLVGAAKEDPRLPAGAAVPFLELMGIVVGAQMMAKAALAAQGATDGFLAAKLITADFYADHVLSKVDGLGQSIQAGSKAIMALDEALL